MVLTIFVSVDSSPRPFGPRAAGAPGPSGRGHFCQSERSAGRLPAP